MENILWVMMIVSFLSTTGEVKTVNAPFMIYESEVACWSDARMLTARVQTTDLECLPVEKVTAGKE